MGLKGISGVVLPKPGHRASGSVTIKFSSVALESGTKAYFRDKAHFGTGDFVHEPCKIVSLRHIKFEDSDKSGGLGPLTSHTHSHTDKFNLDDTFIMEGNKYTGIKIDWSARPGETSEIREISVFIVGEAAD